MSNAMRFKLIQVLTNALPRSLYFLDDDQLAELACIIGTVDEECNKVGLEALE